MSKRMEDDNYEVFIDSTLNNVYQSIDNNQSIKSDTLVSSSI